MKTKIYIVDDHPIVIEGLTKVLGQEQDWQIVGHAKGDKGSLAEVAKSKPDLVKPLW